MHRHIISRMHLSYPELHLFNSLFKVDNLHLIYILIQIV